MVYLREIDVKPHDSDTPFEASNRAFINSMQPYKDSSVNFAAYVPAAPNPIDRYSQLVAVVLLVGFLVWK